MDRGLAQEVFEVRIFVAAGRMQNFESHE